MSATTDKNRDEVVGTTPAELREQALARVKKRQDLKAHAVIYTLVNLPITEQELQREINCLEESHQAPAPR